MSDQFDTIKDVHRIYKLQNSIENLQKVKASSVKERLAKIKKIEQYVLDPENQELLNKALWNDLRKSKNELLVTELSPVLASIKHIKSRLKSWMRDHYVEAPITMLGIQSRIKYEPKGHVLIIAPWNYPFQLVINPLVHAIAAGNVITIKPSEIASHTAGYIKAMVQELFEESEIAVIEGDVPVTTALLEKQYHHIFFTGSPKVGKIVMSAAAKHLCSVTLELGGKSPVIVDDSVNIKKVAGQIAWAKSMNAGQVCIAPDYLIIHQSKKADFIKEFQVAIQKFFGKGNESIQDSKEYCRIINASNFDRLTGLLDSAKSKGASVVCGGESAKDDLFISPTLLDDVTDDMRILQEEIFGPLLPIVTFDQLEEIPAIIQRKAKPLAFYIMSKRKKTIQYLLENSSAGGTGINELMISTINPHLPFGGVNNSGIGKSNGKFSFIEFSNERGVLKRKFADFKMLYPPISDKIAKLIVRLSRM